MRLLVLSLLAASLSACTIQTETDGNDPAPPDETTAAPTPPPSSTAPTKKATPTVSNGVLPEVVELFMWDHYMQGWMCTATLVAPDRIVTAAHCLDTKQFVRYEIRTSNIAGSQTNTIAATDPRVWGGDYSDVANPDLGFLTLSKPVDLPAYAELTDVVARVDAGEDVRAAAVVRTAEKPYVPFHVVDGLAVTSTASDGYMHGFGTPMFSEGGDSGAGLFLFENGKITHKLIGIARQPEPSRDRDHFTRVDSDLTAWYGQQYPQTH
jgi:hypothetical protein